MVDWKDPDLEAKLGALLIQSLYAIFGLYTWEYIRSSHVEVALLRRQLPFRWPLLSYISARFSFLITVILLATQSSSFYTSLDCQGMNFAIVFSINAALGCSTTNLMIRTWLIWKTSYLRLLLVLFSLGHWTVLALFLATVSSSPQNGVCMIHSVLVYGRAVVVYGMLYDLTLLVLTIIGLLRMPSSSTLWKTLMKQGVMYFIINLVTNIILLALNRLNLNPTMNAIFAPP
ncbi:hypothetical protein BDR04DRAFT_1233204, partial [Suillus decipiens]